MGEPSDLLRFNNGDQLHGQFQGIVEGPQALWQRDDLAATVAFKTANVRQVVLREGRPIESLVSLSHIGLVNGDRIPGTVTSLDAEAVGIETVFSGLLRIPRDQVAMLAPRPLGGRVVYHGPFAASEWTMIHNQFPEGLPPVPEKRAEGAGPPEDEAGAEETAPRWDFSGAAWYWQDQRAGTALVRKAGMPDRSILKFNLAWKSRFTFSIAFHADFKRPEPDDDGADENKDLPLAVRRFDPADSGLLPNLFGSSYVIQLSPTYVMLSRTGFDSEGNPRRPEQVRANNSQVRLGEAGDVEVEIRCNRHTGEISLFVDGQFLVQWSEGEGEGDNGYAGKGSGLGFLVQSENSPVRLSEIVLAEWNGMPDSARSLQTDDQDIVLLANGTDRFSGTVRGLTDGKLHLDGKYGGFKFPLDEVAEVRFARDRLGPPEEMLTDEVIVRFHPMGRISGRPLSGDSRELRLLTSSAGEIPLNLDSAIMLDFQPSDSFLDDWDPQF